MADIVLGGVGAIVGSLYGNPMLGFSIGMTIGGLLFPPEIPGVEQGKLQDLRLQGASQGTPIPVVFGRAVIGGSLIWGAPIKKVVKGSGGGKGKPKVTTYTYFVDCAVMICEGPIARFRRIWADDTVIYDNRPEEGAEDFADWLDPDDLELFLGTEVQTASPLIQADKGVGDTPAYRGRAYFTVANFPMNKFGGRIPNFKAEVDTESSGVPDLETVVIDLVSRVGIDSGDVDLSSVSAISCRGLVVPNRTELRHVLSSLESAYMLDFVEVDGQISAIVRGGASSGTLDADDLGASTNGPAERHTVALSRTQEVDLPQQVNVVYLSAAIDFQTMTQNGIREWGSGDEPKTLQMSVVLNEAEAKKVAVVTVHEAWIERTQGEIRTLWKLLGIGPGDVWDVPTPIGTVTMKVVRQTLGLFGHLEMSLVENDPDIYTQTVTGATPPINPNNIDHQNAGAFVLADTVALIDTDADQIGFYSEAGGGGTPWPGMTIECTDSSKLRVLPSGTTQSTYATHPAVGAYGQAESVLSDFSGGDWDRTNTVDVSLEFGDAPTSLAEDVVLTEGLNVIVIGQEILQFADVTDLGGGIYRLATLLRGRRGTDTFIDSHALYEAVFIPSEDTTQRVEAVLAERDVAHNYRGVESGRVYADPGDYPTFGLTIVGRSRMPLSPCRVEGAWDSPLADDLTFSWIRRARKNASWADYADVPLDETSEDYEVDVYDDNTFTTVVRTLSVTGATSVEYDEASIFADFGSYPTTHYVGVFQVSDVVGRGFERQATITR